MNLVELLILLFIASVCGAIGQALAGYTHGGCLMSMVIGFIGALLGSWLARQLSLPEPFPVTVGSRTFPILWSIVGSSLFVAIVGLISPSGRR
jgi:uncharacterized membrane protein YeaQ/YmgE (transglycosylase-associated protein family)